jgi:hypothetical protein
VRSAETDPFARLNVRNTSLRADPCRFLVDRMDPFGLDGLGKSPGDDEVWRDTHGAGFGGDMVAKNVAAPVVANTQSGRHSS